MAGRVELAIIAKNQASSVLRQVSGDIRGLGKDANDSSGSLSKGFSDAMSSMGRSATELGRSLSVSITAPLAALGGIAYKAGVELNAGLANVAALGIASDRVLELKGNIQDLQIETAKSAGDLTNGLYQVISAFGDTADTAKILEINAKAAAGGLSTTTDAINLTSAVTKGYGDTSAEAVKHAADLALKTVVLGQTTFPDLAASIGKVVPLSNALGISQQELFAVMATATGVTGNTAEVATQYRGALTDLLQPSENTAKLMRAMGFASGEAMVKQLGFVGSIQSIVAAAKAAGVPLGDFMGRIEGQTLALALSGTLADQFTSKMEQMGNVTGETDKAFAAQTEGINAAGFAMQQAMAKMSVFFQDLYDAMGPAMLSLADALVPIQDQLLSWSVALAQLNPNTQLWIVGIAAAAAAMGPLLLIIGQVATTIGTLAPLFGALLGPMGLVVAGVAALGAAWATNFGGIQDKTQAVIDYLRPGFDELLGWITAAGQGDFSQLSAGLQGALQTVTATIENFHWADFVTKLDDWDGYVTGIDFTTFIPQFPGWDSIFSGDGSVFSGTDFSTLKADVSSAFAAVDWTGTATSLTTSANALRDGAIGGITNAIGGIDWSGISLNFAGMIDSVTSTINGIDWSQIDVATIGIALAAIVAPALTAGIAGIVWVLSSDDLSGLVAAAGTSIASIQWGELGQSFGGLVSAVGSAFASLDWSTVSSFAEKANATRDGIIQSLTNSINSVNWSQVGLNFAGFINSVANGINNIDWSQISVTDIGAAIGAVLAPEVTAAIAGIAWVVSSDNFDDLSSAVVNAVSSIDWGPIGDAFGNLGSAVINAITGLDWSGVAAPFNNLRNSIQSAVDSALSTISFGLLGGGSAPPVKTNADGTRNFEGGWTWVGERGPELLNLPKGSQILSNTESKKMIGQLADGTTTADAAMPANLSTQQRSGFNQFVNSMRQGATAASKELVNGMKKASQELEAGLKKVPGLFGTSQVTQQQMDLAKLGVPQNFADDWIRHLTDEVVNGVNWSDADIKDAAQRAGIDPGLPAQAILELVKQKWNDSSFFAGGKNLDLINQDAVKKALADQAAAASGQQAIMQLFGVTPQQAQAAGLTAGTSAGTGVLTGMTQTLTAGGTGQQIATAVSTGVTPESMAPVGASVVSGLTTELQKAEYAAQIGASLSNLFTGYLDKADAFADVAQKILARITSQFGNVTGLDIVAKFTDAFRAQLDTDDAIAALARVGEKILELVFRGYLDESRKRNWAEGVNAKGETPKTPDTTTTGGNAIGTRSWKGGLTWVGETGPELVSLPARSRIFSNSESMALAGAGGGQVVVNNYFTINNDVDYERAAYRIADIIRRRR